MEMNPLKNDLLKTNDYHVNLESSEKKPKVKGWQKICDTFFESSTIPVVSLVYQRVNIVWKLMWFIIAIVGLSISIYQSVELIKNYLAYPSNFVQIEKVNRTVYFPSITLCPRNIVNWKYLLASKPVVNEKIENGATKFREENKTMYEIRLELEHMILQDLHLLEKSERERHLFGPKNWFTGCFIQKFGGKLKKCEDEHEHFLVNIYSPYYGSCLTINPGFPDSYQFRDDSRTTILILTETPDDFDFPYLPHLSGMLVSMHSPGSAPVIPFNKRLNIIPGTWLQLTSTVYDVTRLPSPYASNCTTEGSAIAEELARSSPYREGVEPNHYSYSREECMGTCFQITMVEQNFCINPFLAINNDMDSVRNICNTETLTDEFMATLEKVCEAKCQKRCHEFLYEWTPVTQEVPDDDGYLQDLISHLSPGSLKHNDSEYLNDVISVISLNMESSIHVVGKEVPKIELEDVFGAVGGNLGLWIGMSMLSVFELFEFTVNLIAYGCHRFKKYYKRNS